MPLLEAEKLGLMVWSPLAGGLLSGKYDRDGNGPPGSTGRLLASDDLGQSWRDAGLPGKLNSTPWCLATNPADPHHIYLATNLGQLFESRDGGDGWRKLDRELGEVRAILWQAA